MQPASRVDLATLREEEDEAAAAAAAEEAEARAREEAAAGRAVPRAAMLGAGGGDWERDIGAGADE